MWQSLHAAWMIQMLYFPASQISANVTFLVSAFKKTFLLSNFLSLLTIFGISAKDAQTESEHSIRLFTLFRLLPKEMPGFCNCPVSWIIPEFIGQFSRFRRELEARNSIALSEMEGWHKWTFLLRRKQQHLAVAHHLAGADQRIGQCGQFA